MAIIVTIIIPNAMEPNTIAISFTYLSNGSSSFIAPLYHKKSPLAEPKAMILTNIRNHLLWYNCISLLFLCQHKKLPEVGFCTRITFYACKWCYNVIL